MAVSVLEPAVLKATGQLPVPLGRRVMVQVAVGLSAPVMVTVPVGVVDPPVTLTETVTVWPGLDGSGESDVMVVVVGGKATVWLLVPLLPVCAEVAGV